MANALKIQIVGRNGNAVDVNADGALETTATISGSVTVTTDATATAADPAYVEGTSEPLSVDLSGYLRTLAKQSGTWNIGTVTAVTAITNALPAGTNLLGKVGIDQTTPGTTNGVQVNAALPAGTALIGKVGIDQTTPGTTNAVAIISGQAGVAGGTGVDGATVQRVTLATNVGLPAGTALLGKTGIDQTTPGTTNAVSLAQLGATTVATGNGVVSAGVLRVAIASDNTAFSVNSVQSGTWTVQPGNTANTTPWLVTDTLVQAPVAPAAATATKSGLIGGAFGTYPGTLTAAQQASVLLDTYGALITGPDSLAVTGSVSSAATLFTQDTTGYTGLSLQFTSVGSGNSITVEGSNDNSTWIIIPTYAISFLNSAVSGGNGVYVAAFGPGTTILYTIILSTRYVRARVSTYSSGTVTVSSYLRKTVPPANLPVQNSAVLNSAVTTSFIPAAMIAQFDDVAPTTITENNFGNPRMNTVRALYAELGPYAYGRATADTQIKASAGFVHTISIAPTGTVTAGVITLYDNTAESGTVIFSVSLPITSFSPFTILLDAVAATGLYVGFDATLANVQATVSYR